MLELRPYQKEAIQATYDYWSNNIGINPVIVAPTGAGKSLLIAKICEDVVKSDDYSRVLILTHSSELIDQNFKELKEIWSEAPAGIYSASLKKRDLKHRIIFAGVQSFVNVVEKSEPFDLIIIDEAHLVNNKAETRYKKVFDILLQKNELTKIVGFSATPYRLSGGNIYGKNKIFCGVSYEITLKYLIDNGYLCMPITKGALKQYDLSNVSIKSNGEYNDIELARVVETEELIEAVVNETLTMGENRKAWLIFASSINHAEKIKECFNRKGFDSVEIVTGDTPKDKRDKLLQEFKDNTIKCLINVNVLTTGFNAPICDMVVIARATQSTSLYVQMIGRGLRTYPNKENCLIIDFGRNTLTHGTLDNIVPVVIGNRTKKKDKKLEEEIKAKECIKCHRLNEKSVTHCIECGNEFPIRKVTHSEKAYDGSMFSDGEFIEWEVKKVKYEPYISKNGNECLKVSHVCGLHLVNEFIVLNSYFGRKQLREIKCNYTTIEDILSHVQEFEVPIKLILKREGKYMKIEEKIMKKEVVEHSCLGCINMTYYTEKQGYKSIEKYRCDEFKCDLEYEWINEKNECDKHDCIPF